MGVNRNSIAAFHKRGIASIADALGCSVTISGQTFLAHVGGSPKPNFSLESGGFNTDRSITLRWPVGRAPKPAVGTAVLLVAEALIFRVESATSLIGSPLGGEIIVTAIRE
jgi:hypothetical protein